MKRKTYYMHTIDGRPATFHEGQICYASFFGEANDLCTSLKQIRREQRISRKSREHLVADLARYGHFRFREPVTDKDSK